MTRSPYFSRWLKDQCGRNDPIGDLARDFIEDTKLAKWLKFKSYPEFHDHIYGKAAAGTLGEAFEEFCKTNYSLLCQKQKTDLEDYLENRDSEWNPRRTFNNDSTIFKRVITS
jgi:hypothetical protein